MGGRATSSTAAPATTTSMPTPPTAGPPWRSVRRSVTPAEHEPGCGTRRRRRVARALAAGIVAAACVVAPGLGGGGDAAAAPPPRITMAFTGDIIGSPATWPAARRNAHGHGFDYRPMFARLRSLISSADLAICHLETPLGGRGVPVSGAPRFTAPRQVAAAIRFAGYDGCSTASNHSLDRGMPGIRTTLGALDAAGVGHAGTARTRSESRRITTYSVGAVEIAHLSYAFGFNGLHPKHPWEAN